MKKWSKHWKSSKKPGKQRVYVYNSPLHVRKNFLSAVLSKDLRKKYGKKNVQIRSGDKVKIMRGQFKKKTGKVSRVELKKAKIYIEGIEHVKRDGSKSQRPLHPSNVMITELNLDDRKRKNVLMKKQEGEKKNG